uniref:probable receptor-like protein kinase At2g39360 n=1 Tax=Erigeron canadensis TaxID=72917 RepID=UPI001CB995A3|nr:probable receptor-like protein kinase At2g39360 [Erigeron canadensis]
MDNHIRSDMYYTLYRAQLEHFDEEILSIKEGKNKDELPMRRSTVVIKRFPLREASMREEKFFTEMKMLAACKHPNIIKLLGICDEGSEMILVTENFSNGYLYECWKDLHGNKRQILTWEKRLKICLDVASALNYLCTEMENEETLRRYCISNFFIALDENWEAKLCDFVLSNQDDNTPCPCPECSGTTDPFLDQVYTCGHLFFEVLFGTLLTDPIFLKDGKHIRLVYLAQRCFEDDVLKEIVEMMDPMLKKEGGENCFNLRRGPNKYSLKKFVKLAFQCIAKTQDQRPTMKVVIEELQEALLYQENNMDELIISLHDIRLATENFHGDNCIGGGGFGKVYKAQLPQGDGFNTIVAKRLDSRHGQGELQFRAELQILFEYKHENIIPFVGYCDEKNEQIIVYEYASRGSLDRYLKDARLTWMKRLKICIDVATALAFLQGGAGKQAIVIHRDIKTQNILLNDEWDAKLADFGLSLISPINQETDYVIDHACGTRGYLDPLYLKSGFLTKESDIYSFGVVLFEIMCGTSTFEIRKHKGQYLPGFIKESFEKGKHDDLVFEALKEQIVPEALTTFQKIAYRCLHDDREKRPTAKEVLQQLKEAREFQISGSIEAAANHMEVQLNI